MEATTILTRGDTEAVTVGVVTSKSVFAIERIGAVSEPIPDGALDQGLAIFTGGLNAGLTLKIRRYADGVVTLSADLAYLPVLGDELSVMNGCLKRLDEDCAARFNNSRRFQGEPHRPSIDRLTWFPTPGGGAQ